MKEFEKILELSSDSRVDLAQSFKDLLHKKLVLGQTRYLCRYGTLSDGHEKLTPAQRYYQAIKEMWFIGNNIAVQKAQAMNAQADYMDAKEAVESAKKDSEKIRAESKALTAHRQLVSALVSIEDQMRMLDEYNKIRIELEPYIEERYPGGIEQAEEESWRAVFEYRMSKGQIERIDNVPLPPVVKAELGLKYGRPDAIAPLAITEKQAIGAFAGGDVKKFIDLVKEQNKLIEDKGKSA